MDLCAPVRSEAVGDFAEDDRGPDFAFRDVVGRRHITVGEEDEEFPAPGLDLFEQNLARRVRYRHPHQIGQLVIGLGGIACQCRVLEIGSSLADTDRPSQVIADFGGEDRIATIDSVLHIAQHMGEADLVFLAQFLLAAIAIRDPDFGLVTAQNFLCDTAGAARRDLVQHRLIRDEHPLPMRHAVGARGRLIRGDDPRRQ